MSVRVWRRDTCRDEPMWLLARDKPQLGTLHTSLPPHHQACTHTPAHRLLHACVNFDAPTYTHKHTSEHFQGTKGSLICSVKTHHGPHWRVGGQPAKPTVCSLQAPCKTSNCLQHSKYFFPTCYFPGSAS